MTQFSEQLTSKLSNSVLERKNSDCVKTNLEVLGVNINSVFFNFYEKYVGVFSSEQLGFELLDLCEQKVNIVTQTLDCRNYHDFPPNLLVITNLYGGEVIVYDSLNNFLYRVDFEGTDQKLLQGKLSPDWKSFTEFLEEFFS